MPKLKPLGVSGFGSSVFAMNKLGFSSFGLSGFGANTLSVFLFQVFLWFLDEINSENIEQYIQSSSSKRDTYQ